MYLQDFTAGGALTQETAEQISWKTAEYNTKIVLVVDHRRLYAHLLSLCWDELDIRTGTQSPSLSATEKVAMTRKIVAH